MICLQQELEYNLKQDIFIPLNPSWIRISRSYDILRYTHSQIDLQVSGKSTSISGSSFNIESNYEGVYTKDENYFRGKIVQYLRCNRSSNYQLDPPIFLRSPDLSVDPLNNWWMYPCSSRFISNLVRLVNFWEIYYISTSEMDVQSVSISMLNSPYVWCTVW